METASNNNVSVVELISLSNDLATVNANYLTISITIILALAAIFYLFNLKPLQEKISKQEELLEQQRLENSKEISKLIDSQKQSLESFKKEVEKIKVLAEKKIRNLEYRFNMNEAHSVWESHYIWNMGDLRIHTNCLSALISYVNTTNVSGIDAVNIDTCLTAIEDVLKEIKKENKVSLDIERSKELYANLLSALSHKKFDNYSQRINNLIEKAKEILLV